MQVIVLDLKGFLGAAPLEDCSVHFGYLEYVPVIGLHFPPVSRTQLNDLSYIEQNAIFRDSLPYLCVHRQLPCNVTYIQHLESCLCIEESERQLS